MERATETFGCDPHPHLPDLFVTWQSSRRFIPRVGYPRAELVQAKPSFYRSNEHSYTGFFAVAGPAFQAHGQVDAVSIPDLAPTFLALLNESQPPTMKGKPLTAVLRENGGG